ncbi:LOB domain-containing protein [Striga asiatica]|uniref:LOB domain-containing protein n=1 Tax=Striga asiatica TaxID=4170 RepID=A0A5A7RHR0_STRAF|nr:LOB domain-containing protein [Striga asiatica]
MRMSCNGCRVLRKGCSDDCTIRHCLEWIQTPESQAYATVFLAKFYGRTGLINLINAGPHNLRPDIFKSLLHEACGRIVNPIFGSVGLVWSGNWKLCQDAVEAVLRGEPITRMGKNGPAGDIRHVSKEGDVSLRRVRTRCRFKRSASKSNRWNRVWVNDGEFNRSPSHESSLSQQSEPAACESLGSPEQECVAADQESEVELDLTLGLEPPKFGWILENGVRAGLFSVS